MFTEHPFFGASHTASLKPDFELGLIRNPGSNGTLPETFLCDFSDCSIM
jgi:hypothetical protein